MGFEVVGTSEWDARAVIAYSQIHHKKEFNAKLEEIKKWPESKINKYLKDKTFSLNSKAPGKVISKPLIFKQNLIAANIVNKNFPDINEVVGESIKSVDLLTYSFPCQGLSIANMGRDQGIKENSHSTSNLIWQIRRILLDAESKSINLPKFLLMENVKNLTSKKHKEDYKRWTDFLRTLGYETCTTVLNGLEHGSLQKRERVFAISVLKPLNKIDDEEFAKLMKQKFNNVLDSSSRKQKYKKILNSSTDEEIVMAIPNGTDSRKRMAEQNVDLNKRWIGKDGWIFNTLTTKQDRHPNIGMIEIPENFRSSEKLSKRFITTREAYQIMGFNSEDYSNVHVKYVEGIITKESLYRQAGNSIVVSVLEDVFKLIRELEEVSWK